MLPDYFFPTSVIGSLPRPQWLIDLVDEHDDDAICEREYQNTLDSAVLFAIALQERAGIDVITDGEWRRRTYFMAFAEFVTGFQKDAIEVSLLNGRKTTWPAVVSKLGYARSIAGHEARFVKANTK